VIGATQVPASRRQYACLTTLRFVAAALVVVNHMARWDLGLTRDAIEPHYVRTGMSFFFILSGFILAHVYPEFPSWTERGRFFRARFARIWPAHAAGFLVCVLIPHFAELPLRPWLGGLLNLDMLHAWIPLKEYNTSFNGPSWSISTEFGLYLFFPLLIYQWRRTWHWKLLATLGVALGLVVFCNLRSPYIDRDVAPGLLYYNPLSRLFEFAVGIATYQLCRRWQHVRLGRTWGTVLELVAVVLVILNMRYSLDIVDRLPIPRQLGTAFAFWLKSGAVCCLSFAFVILVMALEQGWLSVLGSTAGLLLLGEMSYSIYIFHVILIKILVQVLHRPWQAWPEIPAWMVFGYFWILLVFLTHLTWCLLERPFRRFIMGRGLGYPWVGTPKGVPGLSWGRRLFAPGREALAGECLILAGLVLPAFLLAPAETPVAKSVPELVRDLASPEDEGRRRAAEALGDKGSEDPQIVTALTGLLQDEDEGVRSAAARALWKIGPRDRTTVAALEKALRDDNPEVRRQAAGALGQTKVREEMAAQALLQIAQDPDAGVRQQAIQGMGKLGRSVPEAVPHLAKALQDPDSNVRVEAANALGALGATAKPWVKALQEALKDPAAEVREAVADALAQIASS
jgi:peptidoglycan/LPS O-acetylase OafA/YrhL